MRGVKTIVTAADELWLVEHYADTKNADILKHLGWSPCAWRTLRRAAHRLGLKKSAAFMRRCQAHTTECARIANQGEGNAGKVNLLKYGRVHQFRKGENNTMRNGEDNERRRLAKMRETRNATIRRERVRINWGLEQRTRLKLVREPRERTLLRHNFKARGYDVPCRGTMTIGYDGQTRRSAVMERHARELGLEIIACDEGKYQTGSGTASRRTMTRT